MIVGIMSDSHGDAALTAASLELLEAHGAEKFFHCGDICGDQVLAEMAGYDCIFTWGNCDDPTTTLRNFIETIGLPWPQRPIRIVLDGKRIALYHGHESDFESAQLEPGLDYIFYGHTHKCRDHRENGCRLINPGALKHVAAPTVALLDLETGKLRFFQVGVEDKEDLSPNGRRPLMRHTNGERRAQ